MIYTLVPWSIIKQAVLGLEVDNELTSSLDFDHLYSFSILDKISGVEVMGITNTILY